jgi:hypothetical protein
MTVICQLSIGQSRTKAEILVQAMQSSGTFMQALEMFTSLRMFDEAKQWAEEAARVGKGGPAGDAAGAARVADLIGRQAQWSEETANYEAAVEMYIKVSLQQLKLPLMFVR